MISDLFLYHYVVCGRYIFQFFENAGLTDSTFNQFTDQCSKAISLLNSATQSIHKSGSYLQKFLDAVKVIAR